MVFFGLIAVGGSYYVQTLAFDCAGADRRIHAVGCLAVVLLAINNLRDISDRASNKRTLAVRFGERFGRFEIAPRPRSAALRCDRRHHMGSADGLAARVSSAAQSVAIAGGGAQSLPRDGRRAAVGVRDSSSSDERWDDDGVHERRVKQKRQRDQQGLARVAVRPPNAGRDQRGVCAK
jgi:hypothetical protein